MDARRESHVAAQANEPLGLGRREQAVLHGDVVELGDALFGHRGQHLVGDEVGVGLPGRGAAVARSDVPWHDVGPEECDDELQRSQSAGLFEQAQFPQLLIDSQAVARLDLEGGDATGDDPAVGGVQSVAQLVVRCGAAGDDAGPDAAATGGHLGQRSAPETLGVFLVALTSEDRMGMALDQAGKHGPTGGVEPRDRGIAPLGENLLGGARGDDQSVPDGDGAVGDDVHLALECTGAGAAVVADNR